MKTTIDLPDELLIDAKKRAAESRTTLRELVARGLRRELAAPGGGKRPSRLPPLRWVIVEGGLPPGLEVADRERMRAWIRRERRGR